MCMSSAKTPKNNICACIGKANTVDTKKYEAQSLENVVVQVFFLVCCFMGLCGMRWLSHTKKKSDIVDIHNHFMLTFFQ